MTALKDQGGAGLSDLKAKDKSLKMSWVYTIKNSPPLANLANIVLDNPMGDLLWQTNLHIKDVEYLFTISFWREVLYAWCEFNFDFPIGKEQVLEQIIHYNSCIRVDGIPFFNKQLLTANVLRIKDLVSESCQFLSYEQFCQKFVTIPFTIYFGLLKAIPEEWKNWLLDEQPCPSADICLFNKFDHVKCLPHTFYRLIKSTDNLLQYYVSRWVKEIPHITVENLTNAVTNINKITIFVKLRSFQYKFCLKAILTNTTLYKYKIKDTVQCDLCHEHNETLIHLFYECSKVQMLWKWLEGVINTKLTWENIVFANARLNPKLLPNLLTVIVKYYIYSSKCLNRSLTVEGLRNYIENVKQIEGEAARQKGKQQIHDLKWDLFYG